MARSQTTAQTRAGKSIASKQVATKKGILRERKKTEASLDALSGIGTLGSVVTTATDWALPTYQEWEDYETGKEALGLDTEELTEWQKTVRAFKGGPDVKTGGADIWTDISESEQGKKHVTMAEIGKIGQSIGLDQETAMLEGGKEWIDIVGSMTEDTRLHPNIVGMNKSLMDSYKQKFSSSMEEPTSTEGEYTGEIRGLSDAKERWTEKMRGISNVSERLLDPGRKNPMYVEGMSAAERGEDFYADPWQWTDEMMVEDEDAPPMYEGLDTEAELSDTQLTQQQFGYDPHSLLSVQGKPWQPPWERQQMREAPSNLDIVQEQGSIALTQPQHINEYTGEIQDRPFVPLSKESVPRTQADWTRYMRGESFPAEGERMANLAGGNEYDPDLPVPSLPPEQEFRQHDRPPPMEKKKWNQMSTFEKVGQYMMGRQHYLDPHEQSPRGPRSSTFMGDMSKLLKKAGGDNTPVFSGGRRGLKY